MSLRMQALLLRFLENGEIQRVGSDRAQSIGGRAGDRRDQPESPRARSPSKTFREDLYYRLNVIHVPIPPLRERRGGYPVSVRHTSSESYSRKHRVPEPRRPKRCMARLMAYDWPGNVRELKNAVERIVVRVEAGVIAPEGSSEGNLR